MQPGPIGVFDSGYGGLTVLQKIVKTLPAYDFIYLGDNARNPYGNRSYEVVYQFTLQSVKKLFAMGCPLVILACNTASAKALRTIQQRDLPLIDPSRRVLGVIRPSAEIVGNFTKTNKIGILGTPGTINSNSYPLEISKFFPDITIYQQACPMWVPLIENNEHHTAGADYFVEKYTNGLLEQDRAIDTIVLGCTHYPLLLPKIEKAIPPAIQIISQGTIVANSLKDYLTRHPEMDNRCSKHQTLKFFTTETANIFDRHAAVFYGKSISSEHIEV